MALFTLNGSVSSFSKRVYMLALVALLLICFCSYCSASSFSPSVIEVDPLSDDIDDFDNSHEIKYYIPFKASPNNFISVSEQPIIASKSSLIHLLLKSLLGQPEYQHKPYNDKRYATQSFHAMRG